MRCFGHKFVRESHVRAFAIGYYWGRAEGRREEEPDQRKTMERHFYKLGYDAGVAEFSAELDQEEFEE